jgi:hypothetical protein
MFVMQPMRVVHEIRLAELHILLGHIVQFPFVYLLIYESHPKNILFYHIQLVVTHLLILIPRGKLLILWLFTLEFLFRDLCQAFAGFIHFCLAIHLHEVARGELFIALCLGEDLLHSPLFFLFLVLSSFFVNLFLFFNLFCQRLLDLIRSQREILYKRICQSNTKILPVHDANRASL